MSRGGDQGGVFCSGCDSQRPSTWDADPCPICLLRDLEADGADVEGGSA